MPRFSLIEDTSNPISSPNAWKEENRAICFSVNGKNFYVLASDRLVDYHFTGDTQCLPLYRYTAEGERVSNITEWGLRAFREHYGDESIEAEDIFAFTYAALHDPPYRRKYEVDLLREFPRLHFHKEFEPWVRMGRELLDLHIGFETAEPYPLQRVERDGNAGKAVLKADNARAQSSLTERPRSPGFPMRLGSTVSAAALLWSGCWTSTGRRSPGTRR